MFASFYFQRGPTFKRIRVATFTLLDPSPE